MQIMESDSPEVIFFQGNHCNGCTKKALYFFMVLQRHLLFSLGSGLLRFSIFYSNGSVRKTLCQPNNRRGLFLSYVHVHLREPFVLVFFWNKVAISFQHR